MLRTAGQVAVPVLGAVLLLEDVHWWQLLIDVGGAVLVTLIRTLMAALPETTTPKASELPTEPPPA